MREDAKFAIKCIATLFTGQLAVNAGIYYSYRAYSLRPNILLQQRDEIQQERASKLRDNYHWRPLTKSITKTMSLW